MRNILKKLRNWIDVYLDKTKPDKSDNRDKTDKEEPKSMSLGHSIFLSVLVLIGVGWMIYAWFIADDLVSQQQNYVSYNEFAQYLKNGDVDIIYYNDKNEVMSFVLLNDYTRTLTNEQRQNYKHEASELYFCQFPDYDEFRKDALDSGAELKLAPDMKTNWATILSLVPGILYIIFLFLLFSRISGGGVLQQATEKELVQTSDVSFVDIIGHDEILDDVKFVTALLQNPTMGDKIGAKMPKGLLFSGPPGTGKTLLAKAIAHEAGVPFLYQNASGLVEMYVGLGARRVRNLFKVARKNAPCIIFFDEIDAIGGKRGVSKNTSEHEQTLNALLQEMDGFNSRDGIFIIAATNRPEELDEALVRSGRFDRQVVVAPPRDQSVRKDLFRHYLDKFTVDETLDIDTVSKQTAGFTGADIAAICNEASIIATMKNLNSINMECLTEAIDKKIFKGNKSKKEKHEKDRQIVAYHEAGHAVMSLILGEPVARASIQATTSGVGGAVLNEDKDSLFATNTDMQHRILICYAGRASEEIKFKEATTGASNDITQATHLMTQYIEKLGFDPQFGLLDMDVLAQQHLINGEAMTEKISKMSVDMYKKCKELLAKNYDKVEITAQKLLQDENISGEKLKELLQVNVAEIAG